MKRILFILVFIILLPGCSHKISLEDEKSKILDVAQELVINKSKEEHSVIDSFEVYDVLKQRGEFLLFYSTYIERGSMGKETRGFWLRGVEKDKSGYKLTGGGGTLGTVTDNPVDAGSYGNNVYGAINDMNIKMITLYYEDGKEIDLDVTNQNYFHFYREDIENAAFPYIKGFNIEGDLLFDSSNGTV